MNLLRRRIAAPIGGLLVFAGYGAAIGGLTHPLPWWWYPVWLAAATASGWLLGSYVDPAGGLVRGCSQCARLAVVAVPVAALLARTGTLAAAACSLGVLALGLVQRIRSADACTVPAPPRRHRS